MKRPTYGLEATESFKPAPRWSVMSIVSVIVLVAIIVMISVFCLWVLVWFFHFVRAVTPFLPWPHIEGL
jgi:hypothetical protein